MKCSPSAHQTRARRRAFTLVEMIVATALISGVGLIFFQVMQSGMILSSQNTSVNVSAARGRQMIDWVGEQTRYALEQPTLITNTGASATGTTADGILANRLIGGPYIVKDSAGGASELPATTNTFTLEYRADLPPPEVGDFIVMETVERPRLEIASVTTLSAIDESAGRVLRTRITTAANLGEVARPSSYRINGTIFRKHAFVFVATETGNDPRFELRHYDQVRGSTNYSVASNYEVMASGFRKISSQAFFTNTTSNSAPTTVLRALVHSSGQAEYLDDGATRGGAFTTVPFQLRLWALNH